MIRFSNSLVKKIHVLVRLSNVSQVVHACTLGNKMVLNIFFDSS